MSRGRSVPHFQQVDPPKIRCCFLENRRHRAYLKIPFMGDRGSQTLCIIGQNPSAADERAADQTIRYLEQLAFQHPRRYREIIILNLYSQVDTAKSEQTPPLHPECAAIFEGFLEDENDFLIVWGKLGNEKSYRFLDRAREVAPRLRSKHVRKLDIGTAYAPHPGNPKILYRNFGVGFAPYTFTDLGNRDA